MNRTKTAVVTALVVSMMSLPQASALALGNQHRDQHDDRRDENRPVNRDWRKYDYKHFEPGQGHYDASRYYRQNDQKYKAHRLGRNERIYRGYDDRYYCRRSDGTTGLIVGGIAGGVLGTVIAPGDSKPLGTILGGAAGALLGRSIDSNNISCR